MAATASRSPRCWPASSRPGAPIRSGCILSHIGHPLMGDAVYGPHFKTKAGQLGPQGQAALAALGRQALHAYLLALEHPRTGELLHWEAALPEDLLLLQSALEAAL